MVNVCELLINAVTLNEPKMLTGSTQKGMWLDISLSIGNTRTVKPPAKRQDLNHSFVSYAKHVKPVSLPCEASEPQGTPLGMRAEDGGKSKSHSVMGRIGIEQKQYYPT